MPTPKADIETFVDRLFAADAELDEEFSEVANPDMDVREEKRRLRYIAIAADWLAGK